MVALDDSLGKPLTGWRLRLYTIIFEADTRAGRLFDQWLIAVILASVAAVVVDSVQTFGTRYNMAFGVLEWLFTIAFTLSSRDTSAKTKRTSCPASRSSFSSASPRSC